MSGWILRGGCGVTPWKAGRRIYIWVSNLQNPRVELHGVMMTSLFIDYKLPQSSNSLGISSNHIPDAQQMFALLAASLSFCEWLLSMKTWTEAQGAPADPAYLGQTRAFRLLWVVPYPTDSGPLLLWKPIVLVWKSLDQGARNIIASRIWV